MSELEPAKYDAMPSCGALNCVSAFLLCEHRKEVLVQELLIHCSNCMTSSCPVLCVSQRRADKDDRAERSRSPEANGTANGMDQDGEPPRDADGSADRDQDDKDMARNGKEPEGSSERD